MVIFRNGETTQHAQCMLTAAPSNGPVTRILCLCQWFSPPFNVLNAFIAFQNEPLMADSPKPECARFRKDDDCQFNES